MNRLLVGCLVSAFALAVACASNVLIHDISLTPVIPVTATTVHRAVSTPVDDAITIETAVDSLVVVTRITAEVRGILVERNGCLRIAENAEMDSPSGAIVWQKDVFTITRLGDELRIVDREALDQSVPIIWKLGERIEAGGSGGDGGPGHATSEFLVRCDGPYVFVSSAPSNSEPVLTP